MKNNLIVLTAGGTGGHVYPAEALASELLKRKYEILLYTDKRGLNNYKGKLGEIENKAILSGSVVGKSVMTKIISLVKVSLGIGQAMICLIKRRPKCVVGFGGYASFPTAVAAIILGIPLVIHEQNSVMSRTNRVLAKFASYVAQSFKTTKNTPAEANTFFTGMPIRKNIAELVNKEYQAEDEKGHMVLLVLGGSQGAKIFADVVADSVKDLDEKLQKNLIIYQQCRKGQEQELNERYKDAKCKVVVKAFFENMAELYEKSSMIISRAGASSVYEIAAAGLPSILVPLASAADNHQYFNALEFKNKNAGLVIEQKDFNKDKLKTLLDDWLNNPKKLKKISDNAKKIAITDATEKLADKVEKL